MAVEIMFRAAVQLNITQFHEHNYSASTGASRDFSFGYSIENHTIEIHFVRVGGVRSVTEHPHLFTEQIERDVGENIIVIIGR